MPTKKLFIIATILLVLATGSLIVYNFFIKKPSPTTSPESSGALPSAPAGRNGGALPGGATATPTKTPKLADLKLKPISQEKVFAPALGIDGKTVKYYSRANANVYESGFDGSGLKKISSVTLKDVIKIIWSPDKEKVIGVFSENDKIKKYFFDYLSGQSSPLNENIGYIAWSPDSKKIAYQYTDPATGQGNISVANPDGTGWKNVFKTRLDNLVVDWPTKEKIAIRTLPSGLAQGLLYAINPTTGDFAKILSDFYGLNVKWSPKADKILYSFTNSRGRSPVLGLANENGSQTKNLPLATLVDKCVWSNDDRTIFCALPQEVSEYATWPDDYYKGLVILADDFYKINLETGEKIKITGSSTETSYDAQDLFLSPKEDHLFFVNRKDGLLYSLKL